LLNNALQHFLRVLPFASLEEKQANGVWVMEAAGKQTLPQRPGDSDFSTTIQ
jgi:hypothetical protein